MKVNTSHLNTAFQELIQDLSSEIVLDANIIIPPGRYNDERRFDFQKYKEIFLNPLFKAFNNLTIHESVYSEFTEDKIKKYVDGLLGEAPPLLKIFRDSSLSSIEKVLRDTIEGQIYPFTEYDPTIDNKIDRGEVKTLSYIAANGCSYFVSYDFNAINLVEKTIELGTGLDNVSIIHNYELIYYFLKMDMCERQGLRILYRYLYYFLKKEKRINPSWNDFIVYMNNQYGCLFN